MKKKFLARIVKRAGKGIGIITGLIVFTTIIHALNYVYVQEELWFRILWHHFYEDKGKIDSLYLGSSHVYCDIDPRILDELNGQYNFNLSTPEQGLNSSFYLLREADRQNNLSHVYLELYYMYNTKDLNGFEAKIHKRNWQNIDYMKTSINKLTYALSIAEPDKYIDICMPFSRYRGLLGGDKDYIKKVIAEKNEERYSKYQYNMNWGDDNGYGLYLGQGFFDTTRILMEQKKYYPQERVLDEHPMGNQSEQYMRKIIQYCQKKGISITLFVSPICDLQLVSTGDYDNYVDEVRRIAREYDVPFYDFNLAKEEYLPIQRGEYFMDIGHLNSNGAGLFSHFFYTVVSGGESENTKFFYDSYDEKLRTTIPAIYGLYYKELDDEAEMEEPVVTVWVASNRENSMEYKIVLTPEEGEQYIIQDFDVNKRFTVPLEEHGICTVEARMKESLEKVQTMEVDY